MLIRIVTRCVAFMMYMSSIACTNKTPIPEFNPVTNADLQSLNTQIELSVSQIENSYRNGDILRVAVRNISNTPVSFSDDFGVRIFTIKGNEWVQVQNGYSYKRKPGILPPNKKVHVAYVIETLPVLPDLAAPQRIRVFVVGYPEHRENHPVGAFIDINLDP